MGSFTPKSGTLYKTLYEQIGSVLDVEDFDDLSRHPCHGDPVGRSVYCQWVVGGYSIRIVTPQFYGERDPEGRTTGVLMVECTVGVNDPHLQWLKPAKVAQTFLNSTSNYRTKEAEQRIAQVITSEHYWYRPQVIRSPGDQRLGPKRARFVPLFCEEKHRIFAGQAEGPCDPVPFECPRGFFQQALLSEAQRLELFLTEFQLVGRSSFDFSVAK